MRLRCKAGDLAIIVKEEAGCEANLGRVVHVSGPIVFRKRVGATWLISPAGPDSWRFIGMCGPRGGMVCIAHGPLQMSSIEHPDQWMVPLRKCGEPDTEAAKATRRPKAKAATPAAPDRLLSEAGLI